jgi:hypothetical protein
MALDPSIALGVKPLELQNPLAQYGQIAQLQSAQNQNALAQYQLSAAQRTDAQANVMNELYGKHFDVNTGKLNQNALNADLIARNQAGQIPVMQAKFAESETKAAGATKAKAEAAAKQQELLDLAERDTSRDPSDANIKRNLGFIQASDLFTPQQKAAVEAKMMQMLTVPLARRTEIMSQAGSSAADFNTRRGQNMTDARARERLAAETATGELSPQTIDFVAETYRQTGQLPPLGMGKAAVNMRQRVLDRAAQLSMAPGKDGAPGATAAEAAGAVKNAKADTAAQAATVKDFSSGMSARKVTANNTAINHLNTMEKLADDLNNSDVRVFNAAANAIGKQFGTTAPTNFDAARQLVASEVIKAVVANGGGVTERQEAQEQFARANTPTQLKGVINTYRELLGGQLSSLGQQYETGTGRKDFTKKLSPETAKILERAAPAGGVDTKNPLLN